MLKPIAFVVMAIAASGAGVRAAEVPFDARQPITTSADRVFSLAVADLDGDGDLDVLSASGNDDKIAWYANDGSGGFAAEQVITNTAETASSVHGADLDGDGDIDVLSASVLDDTIAWYENTDGAGTFGAKQLISTAVAGASVVRTADLDGDGDLDVLSAAAFGGTISWYENTDGQGTMGPAHEVDDDASGVRALFPADLDGDGDADLLAAASNDDTISWYENTDGIGGFGPRQIIDANALDATSVVAADIDGDGDFDAVSASQDDDTVAWYENTDGAGTFGPAQIVSSTADGATTVFAADLDGDGDPDLVAGSDQDGTIAWYENLDGAGSFSAARVLETSVDEVIFVIAADVDGDGDVDVLSATSGDDTVAWYSNQAIHRGAAFAEKSLIAAAADGAYSVYAADLDGDGDVDALSASQNDNTVAWYENTDGNGSFGPPQAIDSFAFGAQVVLAADFDGDRDLDVLSASRDDNTVAWYENLDGLGSFGPSRLITTAAVTVRAAHAADLDGDGDIDVLSASTGNDLLAWYENTDGAGTFSSPKTIWGGSAFRAVYAADLDGDTDLDVISASLFDNRIAWFENLDGTGSFGPRITISTATATPVAVMAADLDDDGDQDVISASFFDNKVAWYENTDGLGTFAPQAVISSTALGAHALSVVDLDLDGDLDVLVAGSTDDEVAWYANDGTATFGAEQLIDPANDSARAVFAADIDGDGDADVLSAALVDDTVTWYRNGGGQFSLTTSNTAPGSIADGATYAMLTIVAAHEGRVEDNDLELVSFDLVLEGIAGELLDSAQANALIENLAVYLDQGSGEFEAGVDTQVANVDTLSLNDGVESVVFVDGDLDVRIAPAAARSYFVVVELTADASQQTPDGFRMIHRTESGSSAEDREHDLPLSIQFTPDVAAGLISFGIPAGAVPDGDAVAGTPLTVGRSGVEIVLSWGESCQASDADYVVYEGVIGDFGSHTAVTCSTAGLNTITIAPGAQDHYYLIVPIGENREGSAGSASDGTPRPTGVSFCKPRLADPC